MRRTIPVLALLLAACGSQGPTGPVGPPGPGLDRTKSYCDTVSGQGTQISNTWTQVALCRSMTDIPLSGDCYLAASPGVSEFFYVSRSEGLYWNDPTSNARWICTWSPMPGAPSPIAVANFPGRSEICCVSP